MVLETEPIRLLRECDMVIISYMGTKAQFNLSALRPIELIPGADPVTIEPLDPMMLTVRQYDEDGVPQTICLTPLAAIELAKAIDSYLFFPIGIPAGFESNDNDTHDTNLPAVIP